MKLPKKLPISWIVLSLLGVTVVGMAIGLAVTSLQLNEFQSRYKLQGQELICTAHEKTIGQLSNEIVSLKQSLQTQSNATESKIKADLSGFLHAYYNIQSENYRSQDTLDAVASFVSADCLQEMTRDVDPHVESTPQDTPTFAYQSDFSPGQFFVRQTGPDTARVLVIGDVSISTQWGEHTDTILVQMDTQYDTEKSRWMVTSFTGMEGISLSQITP